MCWAAGPATGAIFERRNPAGAEPCKCVAMLGRRSISRHHCCRDADGMAAVIGAMTGGLAAAQRREREGAREGILGDLETAHQLELALTQPGSERASGWWNHLSVYIQSEMAQIKWLPRKRK